MYGNNQQSRDWRLLWFGIIQWMGRFVIVCFCCCYIQTFVVEEYSEEI